jgi:hypothetical protein
MPKHNQILPKKRNFDLNEFLIKNCSIFNNFFGPKVESQNIMKPISAPLLIDDIPMVLRV